MSKKTTRVQGIKRREEQNKKKEVKAVSMVDIADKGENIRTAVAEGTIVLKKSTIEKVENRTIKKGDVFSVASVAAIQAVKKTSDLIPLCHPIPILDVKVEFNVARVARECGEITSRVFVKSIGKTGVEMEALAGVSAALLSIWDMTKYLEKDANGQYPTTAIKSIHVIEKVKQ